tara:strand:- start:12961 stop:13611 length:651 start_codon:yes stop_codon:yes gene_type:complete
MTAPNTTDTDTELSAVNTILGAIGQSPVTTLGTYTVNGNQIATYDNPEIAFVHTLLKESNIDIQNEGWSFNTENHCHKIADSNGYIQFDSNALRMDFSDTEDKFYDVVKRNNRLYDKVNHTDVFKAGEEYKVDIVWLFSFEDVPSIFKRLITYRAAGRAATQLVTNQQLVQLIQIQEQSARAACMEYECNQGDHNYLGYPHESSFNTYKPYVGLAR